MPAHRLQRLGRARGGTAGSLVGSRGPDWIAHYRAFWTERIGRLEQLLEKTDE